MKRLRQIRGLAVLPAAVWLLIQLSMTGVAAAPAQPATGDLGWQALGLQQVAICSPDGTIVLDAGPSGPGSGHQTGASHCEWCQAFGSITAPPVPDTAAAVAFPSTPFKYRLAAIQAVPGDGVRTGFLSRAPPL